MTNTDGDNKVKETAKKKSVPQVFFKKTTRTEKKEVDMDDLKKELDIVSITGFIILL